MQPEIAMALARQHYDDLCRDAARYRAGRRRRLPRWHITWTRMMLSSAEETAGTSGAGPGRPRSSWMIIITPGRPG